MKCPHCNADMRTRAYGPHGIPLSFGLGLLNDMLSPEAWRTECPHCMFSGPRQSSKQDAEASVRRLTGPFTLKAVANGVKSAVGAHGVGADATSIAKRILGELKREGQSGQDQEA